MTGEMGIEELRKALGPTINRVEAGQTIHITRNGRPVAAITPLEATMDTSKARTIIGDWTTVEPCSASIDDTVRVALGEYAGDYDLPGLVAAFRTAIDDALPGGLSLCGDQFIGPWGAPYPASAIREAYASVDLYAIAPTFDRG